MARLGSHIRFFIRKKMAEDPVWQKPTIVFSGMYLLRGMLVPLGMLVFCMRVM